MKVDGRCHCGHIRYEAEIDPDTVAICNCTDCQTLSGSAFRTVVPTKKGSFKLLQGELKIYVKTGRAETSGRNLFAPIVARRSIPRAPSPIPRSTRSASVPSASAINSCRSCNIGTGLPSAGLRASVRCQVLKSSVRRPRVARYIAVMRQVSRV
jgi:hypothetical protein